MKLSLFLIHNLEEHRLRTIRSFLQNFCKSLPKTTYKEIYHQDEPTTSFYLLTRRIITDFRFKQKRNRYLDFPNTRSGIFYESLRLLSHRILRYKLWRQLLRNFSIEAIVTRKHLQALENFVGSRNDFALVLESDAVPPSERLSGILTRISDFSNKPLFVNLGEGFDLNSLGVSRLAFKTENFESFEIRNYNHIFANTAVAYFVNRPMANLILKHCNRNFPAYLPIDWTIDDCGVEIWNSGIDVNNVILIPAPFGHGSRREMNSWRTSNK